MRVPTAEQAESYLGYRAYVIAQVARIAAALEAWEDWDVDRLLPPAERRFSHPPSGGREALSALHYALLTELYELDAAPPDAQPPDAGAGSLYVSQARAAEGNAALHAGD